jgi:hypothetical protein
VKKSPDTGLEEIRQLTLPHSIRSTQPRRTYPLHLADLASQDPPHIFMNRNK